jgi:hypothetical protein
MRFRFALALSVLAALQARTAGAQTLTWYWCETWRAYYPALISCPAPWRPVYPTTAAPQPSSGAAAFDDRNADADAPFGHGGP